MSEEHNPDNLTSEQVGEGWRLLRADEPVTDGDECFHTANQPYWVSIGYVGRREKYHDITYRRRVIGKTKPLSMEYYRTECFRNNRIIEALRTERDAALAEVASLKHIIEALRTERDAALAEVASLKHIIEAPSAGEVPTPRTDTFELESSRKIPGGGNTGIEDIHDHADRIADFARQLERETIELGKQVAEMRALHVEDHLAINEVSQACFGAPTFGHLECVRHIESFARQLATEQAKVSEYQDQIRKVIAMLPADCQVDSGGGIEGKFMASWSRYAGKLTAAHQRNRELVEAIEKAPHNGHYCTSEVDCTCWKHAALSRALTSPAVSPNRPKVVCLCGSSKHPELHMRVMMNETLAGHIVIPMGLYGHADFPIGARAATNDGDESTAVKQMLDTLHHRKIDLADEVLVVRVDGYIGNSTRREIEYAESIGKTVRYFDAPLPPSPDSGKAGL